MPQISARLPGSTGLPMGPPTAFTESPPGCTGRPMGGRTAFVSVGDDSLEKAPVDDRLADHLLGVAAEEHAEREDDRRAAFCLERLHHVHDPCVVAVLLRRLLAPARRAPVVDVAIRPVFQRERRIDHDEVELPEFVSAVHLVEEARVGERGPASITPSAMLWRTRFIFARPAVTGSYSWP